MQPLKILNHIFFVKAYIDKYLQWILLMILVLIWGSSFILMKRTLDFYSNTELGSMRIIFAGLVFTLPVYFSWGIQSIWWIKFITAVLEMVVVAVWLKGELQRVQSRMSIKRERLTA